MFMFWSKRTALTKRLLKAKVRGEHETECEAQEDPSRINRPSTTPTGPSSGAGAGTGAVAATTTQVKEAGGSHVTTSVLSGQHHHHQHQVSGGRGAQQQPQQQHHQNHQTRGQRRLHQGCCGGGSEKGHDDDDEDPARLTRCKELLKSLKEPQLEMLLSAVESSGAELGACVLVMRRKRDPEHDEQPTYPSAASCCRPHRRYNHRPHHFDPHLYHHRHHRRLRRSSSLEDEDEPQDDPAGSSPRPERCRATTATNTPATTTVAAATTTAIATTINTNTTTTTATTTTSSSNAASYRLEHDDNAVADPHLLCCQIWRWPDLAHSSELKRLPVCHAAKDPLYVCCNPYHWSRLCKPESPPPPYGLIAERLRPEDRAPSEAEQRKYKNSSPALPHPGSLTTNGEGRSGQKEWCTLAYWELGGRVGRLYPVEPSTVNVFDSLHDGDGLCLATLAENHAAPPAVQRTRSKIGLGLMLSQESDGVWAYNRSDSPIFVNSPTLDDPETRTLLVYRVQPGYCLNIFDRAKVLQMQSGYGNGPNGAAGNFASGPVDVNSVRISFAKGWGPKYSRQEVTSCPCWLEVLLAPCR